MASRPRRLQAVLPTPRSSRGWVEPRWPVAPGDCKPYCQRHDHREAGLGLRLVRHPVILGFTVLATAAALLAGFPILNVFIAAVALYGILWTGTLVLAGLARPIPEPPPPGELRKVRILYRCEICGAEVRMTVSPTDEPQPPRHCQEEMTLVTPTEDL